MSEIQTGALPDADHISVVSFDIWQTLLTSNPEYRQHRADLVSRGIGSPGVEMDFVDFMNQADTEIDALSDQSGHQYGFRDRIVFLAEKAGVPVPSERMMCAMHAGQVALVELYPPLLIEADTPDRLGRLAKDKELAVISNTGFIDGHIMRGALSRLGLLDVMKYQLFSNEVGVAKPDPRIYEALISQADVSPDSIVHIGDNRIADFDGPQAAGMHGFHLADGARVSNALQALGLTEENA